MLVWGVCEEQPRDRVIVVSCRVSQLSIYFVWCGFLNYCRPAGREFQNRPRPTIVGTDVPVRVVKGRYPRLSEGCYTWRSRVVGICRAQGEPLKGRFERTVNIRCTGKLPTKTEFLYWELYTLGSLLTYQALRQRYR